MYLTYLEKSLLDRIHIESYAHLSQLKMPEWKLQETILLKDYLQ